MRNRVFRHGLHLEFPLAYSRSTDSPKDCRWRCHWVRFTAANYICIRIYTPMMIRSIDTVIISNPELNQFGKAVTSER